MAEAAVHITNIPPAARGESQRRPLTSVRGSVAATGYRAATAREPVLNPRLLTTSGYQ